MLYREILVAVDGSRESQRALEHAAALARDEHARLTLVTVIAPVTVSPVPTLTCAACVRDAYAEVLAGARDSVPGDVGVTTILIDGSPLSPTPRGSWRAGAGAEILRAWCKGRCCRRRSW